MQKVSEQSLKEEYQKKVDQCLESLQQAVDKSFNKIVAQLDQLLNDETQFYNVIPTQLKDDLPKFNSSRLLKFQDDDFPKQIYQEVTLLIKSNIQNQVKDKEQYYQMEIQNNQIMWEQIIQQKDYQIQQLQNTQSTQTIQQPSTSLSNQSNLKPFTYQLIKENSIKQNEHCYAIAINKDCSMLVAGSQNQIKYFEFKQGVLKQVEILSEHENNVSTLNFMNKSDQFISGSDDKSIIIWTRNHKNSWICQQKLKEHTSSIRCLVLNNNEDLIVSGGLDKMIRFWQKQDEWLCYQTITDHTERVLGLSLSEQQNRVISCGYDNLILVIELSEQNKQWMVIQKITVESGYRLCFIDNNTFTFYPSWYECIHVFEINNANQQYIKTKDIQVKGGSDDFLFPSQYIQSKCILVNKNAQDVSLIRKKQNGEFIVEQSIQFGTRDIYGCMTDDGQYLITWDKKSNEFQIRQFLE
ncbi:unnamed protein product [Paramecium primaurelia]|uniref:WD40-repeat-containing domain n=1 Tax=Paramecium primaurelia TaxID=5886 RepID=A0A8S1PXT5_PARPR|nr:unnamed protein product [Paramecium primaurelia]